jgi:hypothetical protein
METALHVSGGTSIHHQERIQLHRQHLVFVTSLLLSAAIVEGQADMGVQKYNTFIYFCTTLMLTGLCFVMVLKTDGCNKAYCS